MQRWRLALVAALVLILPFVLGDFEMRMANQVIIAAVGAIGLNILVGYTGQISLGQGAFLAVGAYASGLLVNYSTGADPLIPVAIPWWLSILLAAFITAIVGAFFGIPSLRLKGLYLAVATLAAQQIVEWVLINWDPIDGKVDGKATDALRIPEANFFGYDLNSNEYAFYVFGIIILVIAAYAATNLFRTHIGRAFIAIRDQDIAASVMGVNLFYYKVLAFATSSFYVGLAGAMLAQHSNSISFERFTIEVSIAYLAMIIIGGLGSVSGSIYGAIFIVLLPEVLRALGNTFIGFDLVSEATVSRYLPFIREGAFGLLIVLFLMFEADGIVKLWRDIKDYFRLFPFSY
jgi:branched-chain amino acid transport system permease protein